MGYIYKITNDVNDKVYIGQTTLSIETRFKQHLYNSNNNIKNKFYNAIHLIGQEMFHVSLVEEVPDSLLDEREIYWINYYNSYYNGYNSTLGGCGIKRLNEDVEKQILILRQQNKKIFEICQELKCSRDTVVDILKRHNLNTAHTKDALICEMKEAGYGTTLIASILNCGTTTVNRVLQRLRPDLLTINQRENNKIRARELRQQGYTLNEIGKELKISRQTVAKYLTNI